MIKCILNEVEVSGPEMIVISELAKLMREIRKEMTKKHGQEYADNRMKRVHKNLLNRRRNKSGKYKEIRGIKNKRSICKNDGRNFGRDTEKLGGSKCLNGRQVKNRHVSGLYALQTIHWQAVLAHINRQWKKLRKSKTFTVVAIQSHKKTRTRQCTGKRFYVLWY